MKKKISIALVLLLVFLCVSCMLLFRTGSSSGLWKSYLVLITQSVVPEDTVLEGLAQLAVHGTVSSSSSFIDLYPSLFPIESYFGTELASSFFTDKNTAYTLYYIPRSYESALLSAKRHNQLSFDFFLDTEQHMPNTSFFISMIILLFLLGMSKNKQIFIVLSLPCILFSFSFPSTGLLPLLLSLMYTAYYVQQRYGRAHTARACISHKMVILLISCTIVSLFFIPVRALMMFPLLIVLCASGFYVMHEYISFSNQKKRFVPVLILSASYKKRESKKMIVLFIPAALSVLAALLIMLFYTGTSSSPAGTITLPAPMQEAEDSSFTFSGYASCLKKETDLPSLAHYVTDCWNSSIFPYTKIPHSKYPLSIPLQSSAGITRYKKEGQTIKSYVDTLFVFDNIFIDSILEGIDYSRDAGIQQVLLGQNTFTPIVYKPIHSTSDKGKLLLLLSISCIFFLLLTGISYKDLFLKEHA